MAGVCIKNVGRWTSFREYPESHPLRQDRLALGLDRQKEDYEHYGGPGDGKADIE